MDTLLLSEGWCYALTCAEAYSELQQAYPRKCVVKKATTCGLQQVCAIYGLPTDTDSNGDSHCLGCEMKKKTQALDIISISTYYIVPLCVDW